MAQSMRGQVALWTIIGLVIVVLVGLFIIVQVKPKTFTTQDDTPVISVQTCVKTTLQDTIDQLMERGGFIEPRPALTYNNKSIAYTCYNRGNYEPCIMQHPLFVHDVERELENRTLAQIERCFSETKSALEAKGYTVFFTNSSYSVQLLPDAVRVVLMRDTTVDDGVQAQHIRDYSFTFYSPLQNFVELATTIADQEAQYCYFEYVGYMNLYPRIRIETTSLSESSKLYTLTDSKTQNQFVFGVRGCTIPPGI